jgi:hypothetical protein
VTCRHHPIDHLYGACGSGYAADVAALALEEVQRCNGFDRPPVDYTSDRLTDSQHKDFWGGWCHVTQPAEVLEGSLDDEERYGATDAYAAGALAAAIRWHDEEAP